MVRIKICGIKTVEDALVAVAAGADAVGMVFAPSTRQISAAISREICHALPPLVNKVGVFVDASEREVKNIAGYCGLDTLQFHGRESPEYCRRFSQKVIKGFRVKDEYSLAELKNYPDSMVLLDSYSLGQAGGTGQVFPWELAVRSGLRSRMILAGGLHAGNVLEAIRAVRPFAVDVSSGVETNGRKDAAKIREFITTIRRWEYGNEENRTLR
ncbi:n-(5'phosphoribosyl) anthranilate isomerase (prai) [Lucifera butyrica]|uniref:N-(5'-phosphoribosyl)anthranilate isomerase n=1 Tax=Lucifera butyrica TaxID=1351585 RepID=A0A498R206_9FIRM|nr:phosphoribosylanthranilate isomerase [Lucifera butyrica]VBB06656.1 n-(5'phosphoribosyl) anthranilate isomerase (prai) [Lucifera butyrica]